MIIYYFIATFVPIDKVIGKVYPLFGICLIVMAMGVGKRRMIFDYNENRHERGGGFYGWFCKKN